MKVTRKLVNEIGGYYDHVNPKDPDILRRRLHKLQDEIEKVKSDLKFSDEWHKLRDTIQHTLDLVQP